MQDKEAHNVNKFFEHVSIFRNLFIMLLMA